MIKAAIIGAGLMGTAMSWPLSDNNHDVRLIGTHLDDEIIESCKKNGYHPPLKRYLPDRVHPHFFSEIDEALSGVDVIVSGVSSMGVDWISDILSSCVTKNQKIIGITKGLKVDNDGEIIIFPEIIEGKLPDNLKDIIPVGAVGGPCIAGELAGRRHTCIMFGSRHKNHAEELASIFRTDYYHISPTEKLLSLEIGVALKNAFTVAVGQAYGLLELSKQDSTGASMHNTAAAVFAEGCHEIRTILRIVGGDENMAAALPGAGDLFVTSAGGRTISLGKLLGSGKSYSEARSILHGVTLESVEIIHEMARAFPIWERKGKIKPEECPLLRMLITLIHEGKPSDIPFDKFFV